MEEGNAPASRGKQRPQGVLMKTRPRKFDTRWYWIIGFFLVFVIYSVAHGAEWRTGDKSVDFFYERGTFVEEIVYHPPAERGKLPASYVADVLYFTKEIFVLVIYDNSTRPVEVIVFKEGLPPRSVWKRTPI